MGHVLLGVKMNWRHFVPLSIQGRFFPIAAIVLVKCIFLGSKIGLLVVLLLFSG